MSVLMSKKRKRVIFEDEKNEGDILARDLLSGVISAKGLQTEGISTDFIKKCENDFAKDPANIIARNAITKVGAELSTTNSKRVNELTYTFLNTVKGKHARATNQSSSGRCWQFAALNTLRHIFINALDLGNFEFSEVYLFFWDKLERANSYLRWFIENPQENIADRPYGYMITDYMNDGGWFNTFANLIEKYGLVPLNAMQETYQSGDTSDMNNIIKEQLDSTVNYIRNTIKKVNIHYPLISFMKFAIKLPNKYIIL